MTRPSVEAEREEQILAAACAVLADRGYRMLRVRDVAERAGVSTGTIHYYFGTKRSLVHGAFEYNFQRSIARRRDILETPLDPRTKLERLADSYLPHDDETVRAWRVWADIWVEGLREPDLRDLNERVYDEWRRIVARFIEEGQAEGLLVDGDPIELANPLIATIDGLSLQVLLGSRKMSLRRAREICLNCVRELEKVGPEPARRKSEHSYGRHLADSQPS